MTLKIGTISINNCENGANISGDNISIDFVDIADTSGEAFKYTSEAVAIEKIRFQNEEQKIAFQQAASEIKKLPPGEITEEQAKGIFDAANLTKWLKVGTDLVDLAAKIAALV
ncbi:hypothetical protein [Serratia marcescens]|uniref:hypothetical protein n=1 Tax=Serratia marcescens TaxID=615 RepID=UPI003514A10E